MEQSTSPELGTEPNDPKEQLKNTKIGVAIGSGSVYAAAGIGVLEKLEEQGLNISYIGGASAGALISALYFLEGNAAATKQQLLQRLTPLQKIKLNPFGKVMSGEELREIIEDVLDGRNWQDGKSNRELCLGAAFQDAKKPVILTQETGLSLIDSVLASVSINRAIEPIVKTAGSLSMEAIQII